MDCGEKTLRERRIDFLDLSNCPYPYSHPYAYSMTSVAISQTPMLKRRHIYHNTLRALCLPEILPLSTKLTANTSHTSLKATIHAVQI